MLSQLSSDVEKGGGTKLGMCLFRSGAGTKGKVWKNKVTTPDWDERAGTGEVAAAALPGIVFFLTVIWDDEWISGVGEGEREETVV